MPLCHWSSQLFDLRALPSTDVPVLLLFRYGPNICSHCTKVWHRTCPVCDAALRGAAKLRSVSEIALISPFYPVWFQCRRKSYPVWCKHSPGLITDLRAWPALTVAAVWILGSIPSNAFLFQAVFPGRRFRFLADPSILSQSYETGSYLFSPSLRRKVLLALVNPQLRFFHQKP